MINDPLSLSKEGLMALSMLNWRKNYEALEE